MSVSLTDQRQVALVHEEARYLQAPPYNASEAYPEWQGAACSAESNPAYRAVRQLLHALGLDQAQYGTAEWNPLGDLIQPNDRVMLKPNFVSHKNLGERAYGLTDTDSLITHGSVLRVVMDYVAKALQGRGTILIGDCPIQGTDWAILERVVGLESLRNYYARAFPEIRVIARDYRLGKAVIRHGQIAERIVDESQRAEYIELDIGAHSLLLPLMQNGYSFGVAQYAQHRMRAAHTPEANKYLIHRDFLDADVLINLPKIKTHMKAGITCALKNFVGLVGHKDYLPHFRFGSPSDHGDEYPDGGLLWDVMWHFNHADWGRERGLAKQAYGLAGRAMNQLLRLNGFRQDYAGSLGGGGWAGNDTLWRTVLDINRAFFYFDRDLRTLTPEVAPQVKYLAILDGLIGGHKESPLAPTPIHSGFMVAGFNPLATDAVAAAMMGLDINKLKQITKGFALRDLPLAQFTADDIHITGNLPAHSIAEICAQGLYVPFEPSLGFKGNIEYAR